MKIKSVIAAIAAGFVFIGCQEVKDEPVAKEEAIELQFETESIDIPFESKAELTLSVKPEEKASLVEIENTDDKVVTVSVLKAGDGLVKLSLEGVSLGTSTVVAVLEDQIVECSVSVSPVSVESLSLGVDELDLDVNTSYTFNLTVTPDNATAPEVLWTSDNEDVAVVNRGTVVAVSEGSAVITASVGEVKATCKVNVHVVMGESLTLDVAAAEISVDETFITTATVLPEDVTVKSMRWYLSSGEGVISFEVIDAKEGDNQTAARVAGLSAGEAVLTVECAGLKADCHVTVKAKEVPVEPDPDPDPVEPEDPMAKVLKVGDYYYSDGTWSDGGFRGYDIDGYTPKWASAKPAPVDGKKVIGIVFQTDASRISEIEKALGYTHGLVMAIRSAHGPDSEQTAYSRDSDFDVIPAKKTGVSWYADIDGYKWTHAIMDAYPGEAIQQCPAFDWTTTDFQPSAPLSSSGWYVPSIGQLWDMLAALGGGEMAKHLKSMQSYKSDISYYYREGKLELSYDPIEMLNSTMSMVPSDMKEEFKISNNRSGDKICELMSSTLYENTGDGAVCIFWLYEKGELEPEADWTDQLYICRPILSF